MCRTLLLRPSVTFLEDRLTPSGVPQLDSWLKSSPGEYATVVSGYNVGAGASGTWPTNVPAGAKYSGGNTVLALGDIQKISSSNTYVYAQSPVFSSSVMGPWFNPNGSVFMNFPSNQNRIVRITRNPVAATSHVATTPGPIAILTNGVDVYNPGDGFSYSNSSGTIAGPGDGYWNRDANVGEKATFDHANAHQPGNGDYHVHISPVALRAQLRDNVTYHSSNLTYPYDPNVIITPATPGDTRLYSEYTRERHHSPILGWSYDGFPIYGPYGYSIGSNSASSIEQMTSSYQLRNITTRTNLPGFAAKAKFGDSVTLNAAGEFPLAANLQGPAVSATFPLGYFIEDYEYVSGLGTLDMYNGRITKTPEFPNGTYAYFVSLTADGDGDDAYPYLIGRQYYGVKDGGKVTSITESVTTYFDIASPQSGGSVRGAVYFDLNGNAVRDVSELGYSSVSVYLDANNNNIFDVGETTTVSGLDGGYELPVATSSSASVRVVVPTGFTQTTPNAAAVTVSGGNAVFGVTVGLRVLPPTVWTSHVNNGAVQRSRVTQVAVSFSEAVSFPNGINNAFVVQRVSGGDSGTVAFTAFQTGNIITLSFISGGTIGLEPNGSVPDGRYLVTVVAANVSGGGGLLDGNGNGIGGDNASVNFYRLFGDSDGNGTVDGADFAQFGNAFGTTVNNSPFDFDDNGTIDGADFAQFGNRFGITI